MTYELSKGKMRLKDFVISAIRTASPARVVAALETFDEKELLTAFLELPGTNENSILCEAVKLRSRNRDDIGRIVIEAAMRAEAEYVRRDRNDYWGVEIDASHPVLDRRNAAGMTALHQAARMNNPKAAKRLIEAGANALIQDERGLTPYETAIGVWQEMMDKKLSVDVPETVSVEDVHEMVSKNMDAILTVLRAADEQQRAALKQENGRALSVATVVQKSNWAQRALKKIRGSKDHSNAS